MISIICVYNNVDQYRNMVESLLFDNCEIIPVDNRNSRFTSAAAALNYGASISKGDILIFCHQDVIFHNDSIKKLCEPIEKNMNNLIIVGSHGIGTIEKSEDGYDVVKSLDECCVALSKNVWQSFKFNTAICNGWHLYVVELCIRIRNAGGKCLTKTMNVEHLSYGNVDKKYMYTFRKLQKIYRNEDPLVTTCKCIRNNFVVFWLYYFFWRIKK